MFEYDINYINKLLKLRQYGYTIIENVDYEFVDDTADLTTYEELTYTEPPFVAI